MTHLVEIAYFTDDVKSMAEFYRRMLKVDPVAQSDGMVIFMIGSTKLFIHQKYDPNDGELPPENHVAFSVNNLDVTCEELADQSIALEESPKDYYWGRSAYLRDPDGHLIELAESEIEDK
jgi:catechol 2,3-dioxygenase-like lactoylglutathione lyase family enzyme